MLLMVEKGIQGRICRVLHRYAKGNNKYMNNHDKSIISSFLMYLAANNLYGQAMCEKHPIGGFKWVKNLLKFNESFIKGYNENSDRGYFLEVDVEYSKKYLQYRRQRKICCSHKNFKALNHGLIIKRVHRVIQFNQKAWLKPNINMNTKLRKEAKHFSENLLAIEMKKTKVKMNKPVYLGMSILDTSKTLMYKF